MACRLKSWILVVSCALIACAGESPPTSARTETPTAPLVAPGPPPAERSAEPRDARTHGAAGCRVEIPRTRNAGTITWLGPCDAGYAHGLGVLRKTAEGAPTELFLGEVANGYLRSGVIPTDGGYIAGRWTEGAIVEADGALEGEAVDDGVDLAAHRTGTAFDDAARAAETTSQRMAERSNAASSRFYAQLAEQLRTQMD